MYFLMESGNELFELELCIFQLTLLDYFLEESKLLMHLELKLEELIV